MELMKWLRNQWDRATAAVAAATGALFVLLGWLGASRSSLATQQIPYLASGAVAGLFALGIAATLWLSADLRDEWHKLEQIRREMHERDIAAAIPLEPLAPTNGTNAAARPKTAQRAANRPSRS
jgi:hypothetical protein